MDFTPAAWFVIALAAVAANLPFVNERFLAIIPLPGRRKKFLLRLIELIVLYFAVGTVAWLLESNLARAHPQKWEFYAITACLFLVLAYPGFVWRYLRKHRRH